MWLSAGVQPVTIILGIYSGVARILELHYIDIVNLTGVASHTNAPSNGIHKGYHYQDSIGVSKSP